MQMAIWRGTAIENKVQKVLQSINNIYFCFSIIIIALWLAYLMVA